MRSALLMRFVLWGCAALLCACGHSDEPANSSDVVLHVADQSQILQATLRATGEDKPAGYRIEWSNFFGGPAVIAAETGGSVDVGYMMETPIIFAQAAGSPVKIVAAARRAPPGSSSLALVVAADSPIESAAELKGHKIGVVLGSITQYMILRLLEREKLQASDVTFVQITPLNSAVLHGTVDAMITGDPHLSKMLANNEVRVIAFGGEPLIPEANYLVASDSALGDPRRSAAIGDLATRLARAERAIKDDPSRYAPVFAKIYGTSEPVAKQILKRAPMRFGPYDQELVSQHQQEADTFHNLGLISKPLDVSRIFDRRYDAVLGKVGS
jgi:sulfonate transport system substrate-binding protein